MTPVITNELREVMEAIHYRPAISLILPFEPKMSLKTEITHLLKIAVDKTEMEVLTNYPGELGRLVIQKLKNIIKDLNYSTHKKSIAIYVSPVFEKVLYLDIPVEEKIIVDESFEIRDLVYSKKELHKYLVLVLSGKESKIFLGNSYNFVRIAVNRPENFEDCKQDLPERVANFSDVNEQKEKILDKFLHHIDQSLEILLRAYKLPLFVMGIQRTIGHFKSLTKHSADVVDYVFGNYEDATIPEIRLKLSPYLSNWKKVKEKDLLHHLEEAANKKKLAIGMKDVWKEAMNNKGRLLVVEKNFMYAAQHGASEDIIYKLTEPHNSFSYIKDAVDDVIEKVLQSGGDVEFVDEGVLNEYHKIALIQYF